MKSLGLWTIKGYDGHQPKPHQLQEKFIGNQKQCSASAKEWERKNPGIKVIWIWEK